MASKNISSSETSTPRWRILVAIPAYNCEKQIARVLRQFDDSMASLFAEVVVVDNQSTDSTAEVAQAEIQKGKLPMAVLRNADNYNLGGTHKVAFARCLEKGYDGVVILHGDDQGQIADFAQILQLIEKTRASCILGARFAKGSRIRGYSSFRIFGNHIFNWLYSLLVGETISDMGSGLNYYDASLIRTGLHLKMPDDLTFNNCMLLATYAAGHRVVFQPISWREEDQVSNAKLISQSRRLLGYLWLYLSNRQALLTRDFRATSRQFYPSEELANNPLAREHRL